MEFIFQLGKLLKRICNRDLSYKEISFFLMKFVNVFPVILGINED
jgi:hypothetical protein